MLIVVPSTVFVIEAPVSGTALDTPVPLTKILVKSTFDTGVKSSVSDAVIVSVLVAGSRLIVEDTNAGAVVSAVNANAAVVIIPALGVPSVIAPAGITIRAVVDAGAVFSSACIATLRASGNVMFTSPPAIVIVAVSRDTGVPVPSPLPMVQPVVVTTAVKMTSESITTGTANPLVRLSTVMVAVAGTANASCKGIDEEI